MTSCNSLRDTSVKRSSNSHKQRRLLCILSQHCSWKQIPHLSPPPPITVISPICLGQWQVSWSCSLYSFSYKSLLIVSLQGCCASPALGLWQCVDLGLSSHHSSRPGPGGRLSNQKLKKKPQQRVATANHRLLIASMLKVNPRSLCFFVGTITHWGPLKTGDYHHFNLHNRSDDTWTRSHCFDLILFHSIEKSFLHTDSLLNACYLCQPAWWSNLLASKSIYAKIGKT